MGIVKMEKYYPWNGMIFYYYFYVLRNKKTL